MGNALQNVANEHMGKILVLNGLGDMGMMLPAGQKLLLDPAYGPLIKQLGSDSAVSWRGTVGVGFGWGVWEWLEDVLTAIALILGPREPTRRSHA